MKRVLLLVPEGLTFDLLTEEQQAAINAIFGQYVLPMPSSHAEDGLVICDAVCADAFDPDNMVALGLTWPIIGMWYWESNGGLEELVALDEDEFLSRLDDIPVYDPETEQTTYTLATLKEVHRWSGWPPCF